MHPSTIRQHNTPCKRWSVTLSRGHRIIRISLRKSMGAVLLVAVLGTPSQAHAARPITKPAADVASAVAPPFEVAVWTDRILSYLKGLFQLLGGNPNDFNGATPQAAMAAVYEQFEENGIADLTELEVIDAIAITAQLDAALAAPPASIDPGDFAQLKVIEAALYAAK